MQRKLAHALFVSGGGACLVASTATLLVSEVPLSTSLATVDSGQAVEVHKASALDVDRWAELTAWGDVSGRSNWMYFIKPTQRLSAFAVDLEKWLFGPRYSPDVVGVHTAQKSQRDARMLAALVPIAECAIRLDHILQFYEEVGPTANRSSSEMRTEAVAVAVDQLATLRLPFGKFSNWRRDPGSDVIVDALPEIANRRRDVAVQLRQSRDRYLRVMLSLHKRRLQGWRQVWSGWGLYLLAADNGHELEADALQASRDAIRGGIEVVMSATMGLVNSNRDRIGELVNSYGVDQFASETVRRWARAGLLEPELVQNEWTSESARDSAKQVYAELSRLREKRQRDEIVALSAELLEAEDRYIGDWRVYERLRHFEQLARDDAGVNAQETSPISNEIGLYDWLLDGVVITGDPRSAEKWGLGGAEARAGLQEILDEYITTQRSIKESHREEVRVAWSNQDAAGAGPGEVLLRAREQSEKSTMGMIDRCVSECPQHAPLVRMWTDVARVEQARNTMGMFRNASGVRYAFPRPSIGLLMLEMEQEMLYSLVEAEIRRMREDVRNAQGDMLRELDIQREMVRNGELSEEDQERFAESWAMMKVCADMYLDAQWDAVDRIGRKLQPVERVQFQEWIATDLAGSWAVNPAKTCHDRGREWFAGEQSRLQGIGLTSERVGTLQLELLFIGSRFPPADDKRWEDYARKYKKRLDTLSDLARECGGAFRDRSIGSIPAEWLLVVYLADSDDVWRRLYDVIDRIAQ